MPTRSQSSLMVLSDTVLPVLDDRVAIYAEMQAMSVSSQPEHLSPNLAVLLYGVRKARNVSQMEVGRNRARKDGSTLFADAEAFIPVSNKSGFFSLIANIEQGGRATSPSSDFLHFVAVITGLPVETVIALNDEDEAIRKAFAASNRR